MSNDNDMIESEGHFTRIPHLRQKSFCFQENPLKIHKNTFALKYPTLFE